MANCQSNYRVILSILKLSSLNHFDTCFHVHSSASDCHQVTGRMRAAIRYDLNSGALNLVGEFGDERLNSLHCRRTHSDIQWLHTTPNTNQKKLEFTLPDLVAWAQSVEHSLGRFYWDARSKPNLASTFNEFFTAVCWQPPSLFNG